LPTDAKKDVVYSEEALASLCLAKAPDQGPPLQTLHRIATATKKPSSNKASEIAIELLMVRRGRSSSQGPDMDLRETIWIGPDVIRVPPGRPKTRALHFDARATVFI
jgi:hypothetical protein